MNITFFDFVCGDIYVHIKNLIDREVLEEVNFDFKNCKVCSRSDCSSLAKNVPFLKCSPSEELFIVVLKCNF